MKILTKREILKFLLDKNITIEEKYTLVIKNKRKCNVNCMVDLSINNSFKVVAFARRELKKYIKSNEGFCFEHWLKIQNQKFGLKK